MRNCVKSFLQNCWKHHSWSKEQAKSKNGRIPFLMDSDLLTTNTLILCTAGSAQHSTRANVCSNTSRNRLRHSTNSKLAHALRNQSSCQIWTSTSWFFNFFGADEHITSTNQPCASQLFRPLKWLKWRWFRPLHWLRPLRLSRERCT